MNDIERLIAIEDIKILKAKYFRYVDLRPPVEERDDIFTPDATVFIPELGQPHPMSVAETHRLYTDGVLDGSVSIHQGHLPEIDILSDSTARAMWPMEDRIYWSGERAPDQPISLHGWGHYWETYEKIDGKWKIKTCRLIRLRVERTYAQATPTSERRF